MKIVPTTEGPGTHKTGQLNSMTVARINEILGFTPNVDDDPFKVKYSWQFLVDGELCAVWDWKGSHSFGQFSTYGPCSKLIEVFGNSYSSY